MQDLKLWAKSGCSPLVEHILAARDLVALLVLLDRHLTPKKANVVSVAQACAADASNACAADASKIGVIDGVASSITWREAALAMHRLQVLNTPPPVALGSSWGAAGGNSHQSNNSRQTDGSYKATPFTPPVRLQRTMEALASIIAQHFSAAYDESCRLRSRAGRIESSRFGAAGSDLPQHTIPTPTGAVTETRATRSAGGSDALGAGIAADSKRRVFGSMTVQQLKVLLRQRGLKTSGNKAELVGRLQDDEERQQGASSKANGSSKVSGSRAEVAGPLQDDIRATSNKAEQGSGGSTWSSRAGGGGGEAHRDREVMVTQGRLLDLDLDGRLVALCVDAAGGYTGNGDGMHPLFSACSLLLSEKGTCDVLFRSPSREARAGQGSSEAWGPDLSGKVGVWSAEAGVAALPVETAAGGVADARASGRGGAGRVDVASLLSIVAVLSRQRECLPPPALRNIGELLCNTAATDYTSRQLASLVVIFARHSGPTDQDQIAFKHLVDAAAALPPHTLTLHSCSAILSAMSARDGHWFVTHEGLYLHMLKTLWTVPPSQLVPRTHAAVAALSAAIRVLGKVALSPSPSRQSDTDKQARTRTLVRTCTRAHTHTLTCTHALYHARTHSRHVFTLAMSFLWCVSPA